MTGTRTCTSSAIDPIMPARELMTIAIAKMISVGLVPYCIQAEGDSIEPGLVITTWTGSDFGEFGLEIVSGLFIGRSFYEWLIADEAKLNQALRTLKEILGQIKTFLNCPFRAERAKVELHWQWFLVVCVGNG